VRKVYEVSVYDLDDNLIACYPTNRKPRGAQGFAGECIEYKTRTVFIDSVSTEDDYARR